jgi:hypothetical protein
VAKKPKIDQELKERLEALESIERWLWERVKEAAQNPAYASNLGVLNLMQALEAVHQQLWRCDND